MPHIAIKAWPGKTPAQQQDLTDAIVRETQRIFGSSLDSISVGFETIEPDAWTAQVYEPDIAAKRATLTKLPGYGPVSKAPPLKGAPT